MFAIVTILMLGQQSPTDRSIDRAVAYLSAEVPRWRTTHECRSCHHNGDGARALFEAKRAGFRVDEKALKETTDWLGSPELWDKNGPEGEFNDTKLAFLQFGNASTAALRAKVLLNSVGYQYVTDLFIKEQSSEGYWPNGVTDVLGSPVTRGRAVATVLAIETLADRKSPGSEASIELGKKWLATRPSTSTSNAASLVRTGISKDQAMAYLKSGQSESGGWGPYATSPPEIFDTAVALWGLSKSPDKNSSGPMIQRGRSYLIREQQSDGSWLETTRPSGSESLAQRLSTTSWALIALLNTRETD